MSLHSSISSSEARGYLAAWILAAFTTIAVVGILCWVGHRFGLLDPAQAELYAYQRKKLATVPSGALVFVGDSSLGNAIDAGVVSDLTDTQAVNLALTGSYGYAGSYNFAKQVIRQNKPRAIIVMQTIDLPTRGFSEMGYLKTTDRLEFSELSPLAIVKLYLDMATARIVVERLFNGIVEQEPAIDYIVDDYMRQHPPISDAVRQRWFLANPLTPDMIKRDGLRFLHKLGALCSEQGVLCFYAHGPIYDLYCRTAAEYIQAVTSEVRRSGLIVIESTPFCVPPEDLGDDMDHIRPELKQAYTRRFVEFLEPLLARQE